MYRTTTTTIRTVLFSFVAGTSTLSNKLLRPLNNKHSNLHPPLRLTANIIRPRLNISEQFLPELRRRRRPVDVAIATLRLGLLGVAHDDFGDAGLLLLRPPVFSPRLAAQRHFSGRRVDDAEIRARAVEARHGRAALREVRAEKGDFALELGVPWEEADGGHGAEGLAEFGGEAVCGDGGSEDWV
jgi:hypothetical protein